MENLIIRNETRSDYTIIEHITREAFWNIYTPGCDEHYLVHIMRDHEDFVPELDLIAELNGQVVGNVMYTKSRLTDENGKEKITLTFGPISILPEFQRNGIGRELLEYSFERALALGYESIVIYGSPHNYVSRGFRSCKRFNIRLENDCFPTALLVKELKSNVFDGRKWYYRESPVYNIDKAKAYEFDKQFKTKEMKYETSQEEFYINSNSVIQ